MRGFNLDIKLTLARLEAWVCLIDNINATFAADKFVIAMALH